MSDLAEDELVDETKYDFDEGFQNSLVAHYLRDNNFALRSNEVIDPKYFTNAATGQVVGIFKDYIGTHKSVPPSSLVRSLLEDAIAKKRIKAEDKAEVVKIVQTAYKAPLSGGTYILGKVGEFAKNRALEAAIMKSVEYLDKGDYKAIADIMAKAQRVGELEETDDYDYYADVEARTAVRKAIASGTLTRNGITTGYSELDAHLYHYGWGRKELSCIMGPSKSGKSLSLGDFAKNASLAGHNTLYVSLEVAKEIIADRIDAALSDTLIRDLHINADVVEASIKAAQAKAAAFKMRDFASNSMKPSRLFRLIEDYKAEGIILDLVALDYADIMAAEYRSDSLQENLRSIYLDLRSIAHEFNLAMLTATQTNRDGAKEMTSKATNIGDDWNKTRTVDILIGINATEAEKKIGEARLHWVMSRNTADGFSIRIKQDRSKMQFLTKVLGII